jgi:hypothetical protein
MANTVNVGLTTTSNTFNQWRITDNLLANDVNEIARGNFTKPAGNVTISDGFLTISKSSGITLTVASDSRQAGLASIHSIESDADGHVYLPSGDITMANRANGAIFQANINTVFTSANVSFSNTTVGGTLTINTNTAIYATNVVISNTQVGGTFNVASNTTISAQKVSISNTTAAARFNVFPNTYFFGGSVNVANTTGSATFEVTPNTYLYASANVTQNVNVGAKLEVTGNAYVYSNVIVSWNTSTGNALVTQNTTTGNIAVTQNTSTGNIAVTANTLTANLRVTSLANVANANLINATITSLTVIDPILSPAVSSDDKYVLRYGTSVDGNATIRVQRSIASGNAELFWNDITNGWELLVNGSAGPLLVGAVNSSSINVTSNIANVGNVLVTQNVAAGNIAITQNAAVGNITVTQNIATGNISVTGNIAAGNIAITQNASFGNISVTGSINTSPSSTISGTLKAYRDYLTTTTSSGATTVDLSTSNWFKYTLSANSTYTFSNAPASGNAFTVTLLLVQGTGGGKTISWGNTIYWAGGQVPPATTTAAGNTDLWTFTTLDGGSTFYGTLAIKDAR